MLYDMENDEQLISYNPAHTPARGLIAHAEFANKPAAALHAPHAPA